MVEPDGVTNDLGAEPMAIVRVGVFMSPVSSASRQEARAGYRDNPVRDVPEIPHWRSRDGQISVFDDDAPRPALFRYRYPAELISYAVWLYFRFPLSLRMVEEMLAARGIWVTYETIRQRGQKFGREFANRIRRRAPHRGDKWHLDEVVITIAGKKQWLWRAVDQQGFVLDVLVQEPARQEGRQTPVPQAAEEAGTSASCADHRQAEKLRRRQAGDHARRRASPAQRPQQSCGEFPPTDPTTRANMKRFKSSRQVRRFLSTHDQVANVFSRRLNQNTAAKFRIARNRAFTTWAEVTRVTMAA